MSGQSTEGDGGQRSTILATVRESLGGTSRRQLLAAVGGAVAGLAGCSDEQPDGTDEAAAHQTPADGADQSPSEEGADRTPSDRAPGPAVEDDGTPVTEAARTLNFGSGLDASARDGTVTIATDPVRSGDGSYVGRPGDLRSALADASADGMGTVRLVAGATYERTEPIEVPASVILDCTGALLDVRADVNCFELHARSRLRNPVVRTTGVDGYTGSIFHVFPRQFDDDFYAPMPLWTVHGGYSEMTPGEGTCIELHGSAPARADDPREWNVYFCHVAHNCAGGRRFAYLHRDGGDPELGGHVNGNVIQGFAYDATRFVETDDDAGRADNMVNGNAFHLALQPHHHSEWLWYANKGKHNTVDLWGQHWDYHGYADSDGDGHPDWWYIGEHASMNFLRRNRVPAPGGLAASVVDDSDGASGSRYLVDERLGVPVDELGG